jgi:hypothetical protein
MNHRILSTFLLSLFIVIQPAQATYTLPPITQVQSYVNNLLSSYNALVPSNQPNFDSIKGYFSLYEPIGTTFRVIVMQSTNTSTGFVTLNFLHSGSYEPIFTMDYTHTFDKAVTPGVISLAGEYTILEDITINYTNTITHINLAFGIRSSDITSDNGTNSKNAAQFLFNSDAASIPKSNPSPNQPSFSHDLSTCIFAGVCGIIGFGIGIVTGVWYIYEKIFRPKHPAKKPRLQEKQQNRTNDEQIKRLAF